jgi:hypothetical protein
MEAGEDHSEVNLSEYGSKHLSPALFVRWSTRRYCDENHTGSSGIPAGSHFFLIYLELSHCYALSNGKPRPLA